MRPNKIKQMWHAGQLERVPAYQTFDRVHDSADVAHATDEAGGREKLDQRRQLAAPRPVGVERQLLLVDRARKTVIHQAVNARNQRRGSEPLVGPQICA